MYHVRHVARASALALLLAPATATAEPGLLKDIRLWASPDSTRIVLDLSAPASHAMFSLSDPERIVVDLEQTEADLAAIKMPEGTGIVSAVRLGARDGGGLRVVLDVGAKVQPKRSTSGAPSIASCEWAAPESLGRRVEPSLQWYEQAVCAVKTKREIIGDSAPDSHLFSRISGAWRRPLARARPWSPR